MAQQRIGRIEWGDLTFGPGSRYHVTAIEGLDDLPDIRAEDMERPGQHGDYTGPDYTGPRVIQLGLGLRADSPDELRALTLALRAATQPQRQPEAMRLPDQDTLVYGKIRRRSIPYDAEHLWRTGTAALELYCADPYLYGLEERSASTTAYSPAAGRTYPLAYSGVVPATNLALNPSAEVDLTNTVDFGTITRTRDTGVSRIGAASIRHVHSGTTTAGTRYSISPVSTGTVRVSVWVRHTGSPAPLRGLLHWMTGSTSLSFIELLPLAPPDAAGWSLVTGAYTLAGGQTVDSIGLSFQSASGTWWADGLMVETGPTLHAYGDGSMTDYGWSWSGSPHASTSVRVITGTGRAYGSAGQSGRVTAVNGGSAPAFPVLRIDGPVANPSIEQTTNGASLTLDATLGDGEYVLIDTRTRAVLYMGTSPRRNWLRSGARWPSLAPGYNEFAYRGSALPGSPGQQSLLTITWRDTSL